MAAPASSSQVTIKETHALLDQIDWASIPRSDIVNIVVVGGVVLHVERYKTLGAFTRAMAPLGEEACNALASSMIRTSMSAPGARIVIIMQPGGGFRVVALP